MANYYWRGGTSVTGISNIAKDGTGIASISVSGGSYTESTMTKVSSVDPTAAFNGTYNGSFTINSATASSPASDTVTPSITINWTGGGKSDTHSLAQHTIITPATEVSFNLNTTAGFGTFYGAAIATGTGTLYNPAPKIPITSINKQIYNGTAYVAANGFDAAITAGTGTTKIGDRASATTYASSRNGYKIQLTSNSSSPAVNGSVDLYFSFSTVGCNNGATSVPDDAVAHDVLTSSRTKYTLQNATTGILISVSGTPISNCSVNVSDYQTTDATMYSSVGQPAKFSYMVTTAFPGKAFSYQILEAKSTGLTVTPTRGCDQDLNAWVEISAANAGEYTIHLSSSNNDDTVVSPTITLIVNEISKTYYVNPGDTKTINMSYDITASDVSSSNTAAATVAVSGRTITVTVPSTAADAATATIQVKQQTIATIQVKHIDVAVIES